MHQPIAIPQHLARAGVLFSLILAVYMSVYSARIQSGDSLRLFDVATSIALHGDILRDETAWFMPPLFYAGDEQYPIDAELFSDPLLQYLLAFYYHLVDLLPSIGYVHGLWTFNAIITALTVVLLYELVLIMRFQPLSALMTALAFGTLTLALPYTKTLFRESLVMCLLVMTMLLLWLTLQPGKPFITRMMLLVSTIVIYFLAIQTKSSAILALPAFFLLMMPTRIFRLRRISASLLLIGVAIITFFAFIPAFFQQFTIIFAPITQRFAENLPYAQEALHTYLFSIGGSLWGTSPVLLIGLFGAYLLWRNNQQKLVWFVTIIVIAYAFGHALMIGQHWFGGVSWPPRFLLPVVPFASLLLAPVFEMTLKSSRWRFYLIACIALFALYSLWIQYTSIMLPWVHYPALLPPQANGLIEWSGGLNDLRYLRWWLLPASLGSLGYDIAWLRADIPHWMLFYALIATISAFTLWYLHRVSSRLVHLGWILPISTAILMVFSLNHLYHTDPLYLTTEPALHEVDAVLQQQSEIPVPLFILSRNHSQFFMNYYNRTSPRPISLPAQLGEPRDQSDSTISSNTLDLLDYRTIRQFEHTETRFSSLWLLTDLSEFTHNAQRVVERYLTERYYLAEVHLTSDPNVRLLRFDITRAPRPQDFITYEQTANITFDATMTLAGFTLPNGTHYHSGDTLPISLYWQTDETTSTNYNVAVFLAHPDGIAVPIQGIDSPPQAGFSPTNTWREGQTTWDNRALILPTDTPEGDYQLWVVLYHNTDEGLRRATITPTSAGQEDNIAILPVTITLKNRH